MSELQNKRLHELLIDRATDRLDAAERDELASLLKKENLQDDFSYDEMVASMQESILENNMSPLPAHIRSQVIDQAESILDPNVAPVSIPSKNQSTDASGILNREWYAWLATAASLALALFLWWFPQGNERTVQLVRDTSLISLSDGDALSQFIDASNKKTTLKIDMPDKEDLADDQCTATVYWDRISKRGFLKLNNLPINDPKVEQYQLWVLDKQRTIEDRPNAGVFDISKLGENIFEFRSALQVDDVRGFAITIEKPGGVAVSKLERVPLINTGGLK